MHSRRNNPRNPLDQMFRHFFSPPPPQPTVEQYGALRQAMVTLEDSIYQYNRNFREYNQNIRQMDQHLHLLTQQLVRRRPPTPFQETFSFSFSPNESDVDPRPPLSDADIMTHVRTVHYDEEHMPTLTQCPISLERFRQGEDLCEILGCRHVFKREPLLEWLRRTPVCPVCRYDVRQSTTTTTPPPPPPSPSPPSVGLPTNDPLDAAAQFWQRAAATLTRDVSGSGGELMYEFEVPLEMLTQTLQQQYRERGGGAGEDNVDDFSVD